jgi:flagellar M-ring protein FliF
MLGLAFSVAIGVAIVLWSQEPSYGRLYSEIGEKDVSEILEVLTTQGIKYKVEEGSGVIMVPADKVNEVKLKLAGLGLPRSIKAASGRAKAWKWFVSNGLWKVKLHKQSCLSKP